MAHKAKNIYYLAFYRKGFADPKLKKTLFDHPTFDQVYVATTDIPVQKVGKEYVWDPEIQAGKWWNSLDEDSVWLLSENNFL